MRQSKRLECDRQNRIQIVHLKWPQVFSNRAQIFIRKFGICLTHTAMCTEGQGLNTLFQESKKPSLPKTDAASLDIYTQKAGPGTRIYTLCTLEGHGYFYIVNQQVNVT